jgi:formylglycine-generating enzyme required for sulfatase activity
MQGFIVSEQAGGTEPRMGAHEERQGEERLAPGAPVTSLRLAPGVELELVRVPAGEFTMGTSDADPEAYLDEQPQHQVLLDEFLIGRTPVTVAQFSAFAQATRFRTRAERDGASYVWPGVQREKAAGADWWHPWGPQSDVRGKSDHPVTHVSWGDAAAFCRWASEVAGRSVRLPTEAEWEKAARGRDGRPYPWGTQADLAERCNYDRAVGDTTAVGRYSPQGDSPHGCVDMAGNVFEWVADWYEENYYQRSPGESPPGPAGGEYRALRGGSWNTEARVVRAAFRYRYRPGYSSNDLGFRVAVDLLVKG